MSQQIHHPRSAYVCTLFRRGEITPDRDRRQPIWQIVKEGRKKIIYVTCVASVAGTPPCGTINKLNKRRVDDNGFFSGPGCFSCPGCGALLVPYLDDWVPLRKKRASKGSSK
jgi:hypothetical protein